MCCVQERAHPLCIAQLLEIVRWLSLNIFAIAMRAINQLGKIGRNNNGRKQIGKEFSDEDTDVEDEIFFREEAVRNGANST